ncbi:MAG: threonylcarbamoyl-AMP synthase [Clostridia bacterium]|nr:threonylcarbamoyl-AMP synthase [Clostridia bacterium]
MNTLRLTVFDIEKDRENLIKAAEILKSGGLVGIPTETVYGLAANTFDEEAVSNIFKAKGRPQDNPLIVHVSDMEMVKELVSELPEKAKLCAEKFWPGPFTMVLPRGDKVPKSVSAGLDTVAVRMPSNLVARELIKVSGLPLAAPSANLSGSPSPTTADHVLFDLDGKIDAVIVSDKCDVGLESTVISLCCEPPRLLRPGGVTLEQLQEMLPDIVVDKAVLAQPEKGKPVASPGMKYKHYSPKARVIMLDGEFEDFKNYVADHTDDGTFALVFEGEEQELSVPCVSFGHKDDELEQAAVLFDALRELDSCGCKVCYARVPQKSGVGLAVYNRLIRAAAFEVVTL